ncbi:MAG: leucine--tRNA ligase [Magnetococcales bacterium]|nr:leucine--tRNA ligase [Magnetococcales bacterium]
MLKYEPQAIEAKWQEIWETQGTFSVSEDPKKEKYYTLVMFPYPSGRIHMGHVRNYAIGDVVARYQRLCGRNVLNPMGWDAFGMPAENAAIQKGIHPRSWTYDNIDNMRKELKSMGLAYDWKREFATCDPDYSHWEQVLFLRLHEKGLIYRKRSLVNWDPVDNTVLANEQVIDGKGWRSGAPVERKELFQWFMKITDYADELLEDIQNNLPGWPDTVRTMQANWIGKSHGVEFSFSIKDREETLPVYTTRPDTIMGVTFCSIAAEHPLAQSVADNDPKAAAFLKECQSSGTSEEAIERMEKKGYDTGLRAIHPLTNREVPIFIANFVLMNYGTGAVMAVPAHDQRDFEFARKYDIPVIPVIQPDNSDTLVGDAMTEAYTGPGTLFNAGEFDGIDNESAKAKVADTFEQMNIGKATVNYRLRDWGISRQRYWGNPIPMIHCDVCGTVPARDLPVKLPDDVELTGAGNPLELHPEWKKTTCPHCGGAAQRETDTMDTFMESSWYFLRYCCADLNNNPLDKKRLDYWMPVDQYIGGIEHAVLHLLYSRFFHKSLSDIGEVTSREPFKNLLTQGMVRKDTHKCPTHGWRYPDEVVEKEGKLHCVECDALIEIGRNEKMSKSKHNVVDPNALISTYGADTARLFILFAAPPERDLEWSDSGVDGAWRFLNRFWRINSEICDRTEGVEPASSQPKDPELKKLRSKLHQTITKVSEDLKRFQLNTGIAAVMELMNEVSPVLSKAAEGTLTGETAAVLREVAERSVVLLNPYVPHMTEELWEQVLKHETPLSESSWPLIDPDALVQETMTIVVQVNGKLRGRLTVPVGLDQEQLKEMALAEEKVQPHTEGKTIRKVIVVPGRLINIVAT